jgi:hypothetical protein
MLSPIKIILIIPLLFVVFLFILQLRNRTTYRLTLILIALAGILFVIYPDLTTTLAHKINVGRGTDLVFYFCALAGFIALIIFYSKLKTLELVQTRIIQNMAVDNAEKIKNKDIAQL